MVWWHCQQCQWREILFLYFHLLTKALASPAPAPDIFMASMSTDDTWPEILSVITVMSHLVGNCLDLTKPNSSLASVNVPCELDICFIETFLCICSFMLPVIGGPKGWKLYFISGSVAVQAEERMQFPLFPDRLTLHCLWPCDGIAKVK